MSLFHCRAISVSLNAVIDIIYYRTQRRTTAGVNHQSQACSLPANNINAVLAYINIMNKQIHNSKSTARFLGSRVRPCQ